LQKKAAFEGNTKAPLPSAGEKGKGSRLLSKKKKGFCGQASVIEKPKKIVQKNGGYEKDQT